MFHKIKEAYPEMRKYLFEEVKELILLADEKQEVAVHSFEELQTFIEERGKKGITLQRFKGLGEMEEQELSETTMDPETRTLLKVCMNEDAKSELDLTFTTLMGDEVEPRRIFIENNAKYVKNLDI